VRAAEVDRLAGRVEAMAEEFRGAAESAAALAPLMRAYARALASPAELKADAAPGWRLADAEATHAGCPATFWIPELIERQTLQAGDAAKLVFEGEPFTERMWVVVQERAPGGRYVATLDNHPVSLKGLAFGDRIAFEARHVIDIRRAA
jgi:hypothetical protein